MRGNPAYRAISHHILLHRTMSHCPESFAQGQSSGDFHQISNKHSRKLRASYPEHNLMNTFRPTEQASDFLHDTPTHWGAIGKNGKNWANLRLLSAPRSRFYFKTVNILCCGAAFHATFVSYCEYAVEEMSSLGLLLTGIDINPASAEDAGGRG
ncbi:hypothetical protein EN745_33515 [Mesorhizobium sp. M4A.F.Ca.ET.022.05.2.1]|uniref:hypothetical protein n=1 Tax=Mesorhizobium sp. M4A.F.Ca.ET.022.05.2.1 TaxID=2496653 RepID=UPI000FD5674F|nr:hypothetical protein [Mesorhizobium sp. M4A.F.Ca.ET.022.05.2.1]RVC72950.1 hypothetical protein EN745_33515 [Mesorhizobium sp. M4A.F.Ca.ET.022.05.2.1]